MPGHHGNMWRPLDPPMAPPPYGRTLLRLHRWGKNEGCIMSHLNATGDYLNFLLDLEEGSNTLTVGP
jgi:hypothetical protein